MKVSLQERDGQRGIEVTVIAPRRDPRVPRLLAAIRLCGGRISGYESAASTRRRMVALADVSSVRTAGDHAELLLADGSTLQSASRLGELEATLVGGADAAGADAANGAATSAFVRVSRQEIVNLDNALTIRPEFGSRLLLGLAGGHQALVSRTYAPVVKRAIGIKS